MRFIMETPAEFPGVGLSLLTSKFFLKQTWFLLWEESYHGLWVTAVSCFWTSMCCLVHFRDMCACELFVEIMPTILPFYYIFKSSFFFLPQNYSSVILYFLCYFCLVFNPLVGISNLLSLCHISIFISFYCKSRDICAEYCITIK